MFSNGLKPPTRPFLGGNMLVFREPVEDSDIFQSVQGTHPETFRFRHCSYSICPDAFLAIGCLMCLSFVIITILYDCKYRNVMETAIILV